MLPGPTIIRECPECGQPIKQWTLLSGNAFGARFWTDGKPDAPMLPAYPRLVKCPQCKQPFWLDEAAEVGVIEEYGRDADDFDGALAYDTLTKADYLTFLKMTYLPAEKERYVRQMAWWCGNDPFREGGSRERERFSPNEEANLAALSELLDEGDPNQRLMKAEIARERGKFDDALQLLQAHFSEELATVADAIRRLCISKSSRVAEIHFGE